MAKTKRNWVSKRAFRMAQCYGLSIGQSIVLWAAVLLMPASIAGAQTEGLTRLCVLVPHFKDEYWLSVGYGLETEAARQGTELIFFEAGGYSARESQISQLSECLADGVDAILIGTVSFDHPDLLEAVAGAAEQRPVFGLVNALASPELSGRIGVDWHDMGYSVGSYLAARHPAGSPPVSAVLISGPEEAGWTGPLETGLRKAIEASSLKISAVLGSDTGLREQLRLVEDALAAWPESDYLIGSAPAIEAAMGHFAQQDLGMALHPRLIATYVNHTIKRGLIGSQVMAAPFDDPMEQGRMAVRQALGVLTGEDVAVSDGPVIRLMEPNSEELQTLKMSPPTYFPTIE
ncbi:MAG: TMAO reductase system periplasmic protein TorT [Rhodobacteraceae bacterium]|nr:TMAO reductase system periplasmic protein TorT [Paracoccaceae bacterium]